MELVQFLDILSGAGGYGVAALLYYLYKEERAERIRYRDNFEAMLKNVPDLTKAVEELIDEVAKLAKDR